MHPDPIAPLPEGDDTADGICVADGYGIEVKVRYRHLVVSDGFGQKRRERRFHKATSGLRRLVVLGHTGYVTFEALRWLTDANAGYLQLDRDGTILAATGALGVNKSELRRHQALAATNQTGIELTRGILDRKLAGQARVATLLPEGEEAVERITECQLRLADSTHLDELRLVESQAALAYWETWADLPVRFVHKHAGSIPDHWTIFGVRGSPLAPGPRLAANPANAILNYLYALLEAETTLAAAAVGLDPGIGILHADQRSRASLALDLMEAVRPDVDHYTLQLLDSHVFRAGDFAETRRGVCRILPPLTHVLASTLNHWTEHIGPVAEETVRVLTDGKVRLTPLTQSNRHRTEKTPPASPRPRPRNPHCRNCGAPIGKRRKLCDSCGEPDDRKRLDRLAELIANGQDPSHGGEAAAKRGKAISAHNQAVQEWDKVNQRPDPVVFTETILPNLANVSTAAMRDATGLSYSYCADIKKGKHVPHPRHWQLLVELVR